MTSVAPNERTCSANTLTTFSDVLEALYAGSDREQKMNSLVDGLSRLLRDAVLSIQALEHEVPGSICAEDLVIRSEGANLVIRLHRRAGFSAEERFLLDQLRPHLAAALGSHRPQHVSAELQPPAPEDLRGLGLTPRECEVLHWIMLGKRDAQIAEIVAAAPRTVSKHVENILSKLGTESRLAACQVGSTWLARTKSQPI